VDAPDHDLFVGEIRETHAPDSVLTDGQVDVAQLGPLLFDTAGKNCWSPGRERGGCRSVGKQLKGRPRRPSGESFGRTCAR
jgi:hypothetical protein